MYGMKYPTVRATGDTFCVFNGYPASNLHRNKVQNEQGLCVLFFGEEAWVTNASVSRHFGTFPESITGNDDVWKW